MKKHMKIIIFIFMFSIVAISNSLFEAYSTKAESGQIDTDIFTLSYADEQKTYSYEDLENLESCIGKGGRLKETGDVVGPFEYVGVRILTLIDEIADAPAVFNIITISDDGYVNSYSYDQINGNIMVYDTNGDEMGIGGVTMLLAYKEDGISDFSGGPLRITYVSNDNPITDSFLWSKYVEEIEIFDDSINDEISPTLSIEKPTDGIYIFDRHIFRFPRPIIIGDITIEVEVSDEASGISKVLFIVDEELKAKKTEEPYLWRWDEKAFGTHTIKIVTYDNAGNVESDEEDILIFNLS